jgi:uncharacterized membrane protein YkvA (DUF1232 family)
MDEEMKSNISEISEEEAYSAVQDKEDEAEELLKDGQKTNALLCKAQKLLAKIKKMPIIGGLIDDIATAIKLIGDYVKGDYREVPDRVIVSALAGIIYLVSPFDLVPDFIPFAGFLDDAAVLTLILGAGLELEVVKYRKWKEAEAEKIVSGPAVETPLSEEMSSTDVDDEEIGVTTIVESGEEEPCMA